MPSSSKALMDATKRRAEKLQAKGKPVDFKELLRMEPDGGTTNIRNVKSKHWTRWLGPENRCVVPFNSFSEFNKAEGGDIWFALDESRPLACFAGIWTNWTSVRKVKEGETTNDIFAFLTTEANAEVHASHPKAMPVILTTPDEVETWMTAPSDEALNCSGRFRMGRSGSSPAASRKILPGQRRYRCVNWAKLVDALSHEAVVLTHFELPVWGVAYRRGASGAPNPIDALSQTQIF
jgi:putative SOS response-associated peptidase YedK